MRPALSRATTLVAAVFSAGLLSSCAITEIEFGLGDLQLTTEAVSVADGSYVLTTLHPDSAPLTQLAPLEGETSLFTEDEVMEAQRWLMLWLAEQAIDGPLFEEAVPSSAHTLWEERALSDWLDPVYGQELLWDQPLAQGDETPQNSFPLVVLHDIETLAGVSVQHDEGPRFTGGLIDLESITAGSYPKDSTPYLSFVGQAQYFLRITPESLEALLPTPQGGEDLQALYPEAFDEESDLILLQFSFGYDVAQFDVGWRITRIHSEQRLDIFWPIDPALAVESQQRIAEEDGESPS